MRLVLVEWLDSFGCSANWQPLNFGDLDESALEPVLCRSVGWLAYDGKKCKVIVPHISEVDPSESRRQGCGDMTIPTKAIINISPLVLPRKRQSATAVAKGLARNAKSQ
jgi:hypothetical protein